jgi:hypothetical protein
MWNDLFGEPEGILENAGSEIRARADGWTKDGRRVGLADLPRADLRLIEPELPKLFDHLGLSAHARLSTTSSVRALAAGQGAHIPRPLNAPTADTEDAA